MHFQKHNSVFFWGVRDALELESMLKDYGRHELYGTSQTQKVA